MNFRILLFLAMAVICGGAQPKENEFESDFPTLAGDYELIGRKFDSDVLFAGKMSIEETAPNKFVVVRTINGKKITGEGRVESPTYSHYRSLVFKITFQENGKQMEGAFLWRSDLDNNGRISGYVFPVGYEGRKPGLEALFAAH